MPFFTLNRNFTLSTTKGHSVNFKKGEKTWVPNAIIQDALSIGALPEDPKVADSIIKDTPEKLTVDAGKRRDMVFDAFEKILLRNGRGDFMANGQPHPRKMEEILGFEMSQKEREALWHEYQLKKAEEANQ